MKALTLSLCALALLGLSTASFAECFGHNEIKVTATDDQTSQPPLILPEVDDEELVADTQKPVAAETAN